MSPLKTCLAVLGLACLPAFSLAAPSAPTKKPVPEAAAKPPSPAHWRVTVAGYGPVRIGMTVAEAAKAMKRDLVVDGAFDAACHYVVPRPDIEGLAFMVSNDRIVRIDLETRGVRTNTGITIGDHESRIMRAYGRSIEIAPNKYGGKGDHYLTLRSKDKRLAIRFETFGGEITHFYAGQADKVELVEGCS